MRKFTGLVVGLVAAVAFATPVVAAPSASFTADSAPAVGQSTTFTAGADTSCSVNRCQWDWEYVGTGGTYRIGGQLGEGSTIAWTPTAFAASKPYVVVKLKVTAAGGTNNYSIAARAYVVQP